MYLYVSLIFPMSISLYFSIIHFMPYLPFSVTCKGISIYHIIMNINTFISFHHLWIVCYSHFHAIYAFVIYSFRFLSLLSVLSLFLFFLHCTHSYIHSIRHSYIHIHTYNPKSYTHTVIHTYTTSSYTHSYAHHSFYLYITSSIFHFCELLFELTVFSYLP